MSKSKRNTVDPLEIVADFGADTLRMYEDYGVLEQVKPWQTSGARVQIEQDMEIVYRRG